MRVARVSENMKPASLQVSTKQLQGTLRGHREQRDGTALLGTWEIPAARTVSAVRSRPSHESISAEAAVREVGEARSSCEAGESRWSQGALAADKPTQKQRGADWKMNDQPMTEKDARAIECREALRSLRGRNSLR